MEASAREIALEVYHRSNAGGSYANILLPKALSKTKLDSRDKAFITELVYGALRMRGAVDYALSSFSSRPLERIPSLALDALRLGAYQILYLGVPDRAAVHESVELIKGRRFHKGIISFANALLRKVSSQKESIPWPDREADPVSYLTVVESHPEWLVRLLVGEYGLETTALICRADNEPPRPTIRVNLLKTDPAELTESFEERGWRVERGAYLDEALIVREAGELSRAPEFGRGLFYIQDESSMLAVRALGVEPGMRVADICSGPGGKTTYLGELMENRGEIVSVDRSEKRLKLVEEACSRMGVSIARFVVADATEPLDIGGPFDVVLLDAPCAGLGVLGARPDARWRKTPESIEELAESQAKMLDVAAGLVEYGGSLVYSVCTLSNAEGPNQVERFLARHPDFEPGELAELMPDGLRSDAGRVSIQLVPGRHKTNGMFIARMVKR